MVAPSVSPLSPLSPNCSHLQECTFSTGTRYLGGCPRCPRSQARPRVLQPFQTSKRCNTRGRAWRRLPVARRMRGEVRGPALLPVAFLLVTGFPSPVGNDLS